MSSILHHLWWLSSRRQKMNKKDEALDEIANYILAVYTIDGEKYVKVEVAEYLKRIARDALGYKKK